MPAAGDPNDSEPPMVHSTTMKVSADNTAVVMPVKKSTGDFGGEPDVVGDAVFRIFVVALHEM